MYADKFQYKQIHIYWDKGVQLYPAHPLPQITEIIQTKLVKVRSHSDNSVVSYRVVHMRRQGALLYLVLQCEFIKNDLIRFSTWQPCMFIYYSQKELKCDIL